MGHQACSDCPSAVFLREGEESPEPRKASEAFGSSVSERDLQEKVVSGTEGCVGSSEQAEGVESKGEALCRWPGSGTSAVPNHLC